MATLRKLSSFRQLSLNCDSRKKPPLKKQFSEEQDLIFQPGTRTNSRNFHIKVAWGEENLKTEEAVIIKRCQKISRSQTLDKTSILFKENVKEKPGKSDDEKEPQEEKTNIKIFLDPEAKFATVEEPEIPEPVRQIPSLVTTPPGNNSSNITNNFKPKGRILETNALVVVPVVETEEFVTNEIKRPSTAASKREHFKKRTNSAFNATITEKPSQQPHFKPPLIRSTSAPVKKPKKKLFFKKPQSKKSSVQKSFEEEEELQKSQKGCDVVTMVSLVSPEGSEAEDDEEKEDEKIRKNAGEKSISVSMVKEKEESMKVMSLRKTVKSVSFQQSSIHAIRSFSASFPARRASLLLNNGLKDKVKNNEKRGGAPQFDEDRGPKRRLMNEDEATKKNNEDERNANTIAVNITAKEARKEDDEAKTEEEVKENEEKEKEDDVKSQKEQQCWNLYCKMAEKGITVSFDTILRGMLTPTEYRMRTKSLKDVQDEENTEN